MALPASLTPPAAILLPAILVAANRPGAGRTLLCLMLNEWLREVTAAACSLVDADPARGTLARLSGGAASALTAGSRLLPPLGGVLLVDNADALDPGPESTTARMGADRRDLARLLAWLPTVSLPPGAYRPIALVLVDDNSDADCRALDHLRRMIPKGVVSGLVAVRNAGMSQSLPTEADQRFAHAGGWPASPERQAWLAGGGRELVFSTPAAALRRHLALLGQPLQPGADAHPALWLNSRQQFLHWKRAFADRAMRALAPLWPVALDADRPL